MNGTEKVGCCGASCKTCREFEKTCKGCKPGYLDGSRDLSRAKCRMKKCCLTKGHITCADCEEYEYCETIQSFINHPGYMAADGGRQFMVQLQREANALYVASDGAGTGYVRILYTKN